MILAIDCGSTHLKAALFDEGLRRAAEASAPVAYSARDEVRAEFDPEAIWAAFRSMLGEMPSCRLIHTLAITSQAQTFTVLDASGHPRVPFYSWLDKRAQAEERELCGSLGPGFDRHCSLSRPSAQLQLAKLLWLRRHRPSAIDSEARVASLPEFIAGRVADVYATDPNLAAMSGLYSLSDRRWWDAALEACGLKPEQLGHLVDVGDPVPGLRSTEGLGFAALVDVVCAGNDQTAGAFAVLGREGGVALTLGTALVAYRCRASRPGPFAPDTCWGPYPGGGHYELAFRDEGCSALDWARNQLMPRAEPSEFFELASTSGPGEALFFPNRMGRDDAWAGSEDRAARARAVIEGLSFSARQLITEDLGLAPGAQPITVLGGGSRSRLWLGILADVLRCEIHRGTGDALLGAALLAAHPDQRAEASEEDREGLPCGRLPHPSRASLYDDLYEKWRTCASDRANHSGGLSLAQKGESYEEMASSRAGSRSDPGKLRQGRRGIRLQG